MDTNMLSGALLSQAEQSAKVFEALSSQARTGILLAIGTGEACVCHLEALLGWRQAYISQHLMALRAAGLLTSRRDGRFIYYQLADPRLLALVRLAWSASGGAEEQFMTGSAAPVAGCACPKCAAGWVPLEDIEISGEGGMV